MTPYLSSESFKGSVTFAHARLQSLLRCRCYLQSYAPLVRDLADMLHRDLEAFGQSPGIDVYEDDYNLVFDALGYLNLALRFRPIQRHHLEASCNLLAQVVAEGVSA